MHVATPQLRETTGKAGGMGNGEWKMEFAQKPDDLELTVVRIW